MSSKLAQRASWEAGLGGLTKQLFRSVPQVQANISLKGQTALITGASSGLGLESARQFLEKGLSTIILGVRSQQKGEAAANKLRVDFPNADVQVWIVDMESAASVRSFAAKCETLHRIDTVILNAGTGNTVFRRADGGKGREATLQVNYLNTVLLATLLLPILAAKGPTSDRPARLTLVGSDSAHQATVERTPTGILDSFDREDDFDPMKTYASTKLILHMFVAKLAEIVDSDVVIVNVVNPGAVKGTNLVPDQDGLSAIRVVLWVVYTFLARNVSDGARQYMIATQAMGKESHGSLVDFKIRPSVIFPSHISHSVG
jgi:NAD(P)-dependent dehydrogenase (short-subunit alcohol dehydrogenase family)